MSQHGPLAPDPPHTDAVAGQEPEHIDMGRSLAILLGTLLAFAAVVVWATLILNGNAGQLRPHGSTPPYVGRAEVGIVNQKMFELDQRAERQAERRNAELTSYGWVDPKQGIVHIPIEEAMNAVLAEQAR